MYEYDYCSVLLIPLEHGLCLTEITTVVLHSSHTFTLLYEAAAQLNSSSREQYLPTGEGNLERTDWFLFSPLEGGNAGKLRG